MCTFNVHRLVIVIPFARQGNPFGLRAVAGIFIFAPIIKSLQFADRSPELTIPFFQVDFMPACQSEDDAGKWEFLAKPLTCFE